MIRFTKVLAVASALLALPSMASAISLDIVGTSTGGASGGSATLDYGQTITFDLRIDWAGLAPGSVYGASADVTGYDLPDTNFDRQFGLALAGGTSVSSILNYVDIPTVGVLPLGSGVDNQTGGPQEQYVINHLNPQAYTTNLFGGVRTSGHTGDGNLDHGIGSTLVSGGDIHFQVTFINVLPSSYAGPDLSTTLNFDLLLLDLNGDTIAASGDTFNLTMVPEPGTALLMGLGLAGLATTRRR